MGTYYAIGFCGIMSLFLAFIALINGNEEQAIFFMIFVLFCTFIFMIFELVEINENLKKLISKKDK